MARLGRRALSAVPAAARPPRAGAEGEPWKRWTGALVLAWLGLWVAQFAPLQVLLPGLTARVDTGGGWLDVVRDFGVVAGAGGLVAALALPLVGRALDRTPPGAGHRGWYVAAVAACAGGLVLLGARTTLLGAAAAWSLTLLGLCAAGTVLTVAVTRRVPPGRRGTVSTGVGAANAVGIVLGTALAASTGDDARTGGLLLAGAVLACCAPYALTRPPPPLPPAPSVAASTGPPEPGPAARRASRHLLAGFGVRGLLVLGNALGTTLLLFFFTYRLGLADAEDFLVRVVLVYVVASVLTAAVCGPLSDRLRARRRFLVASTALQAVAALALAAVPERGTVLGAALVLGVGWGTFTAVDQAVVAAVAAATQRPAAAVALLGIAASLAQNLGPLAAAVVVTVAGGFTPLYVLAAVVVGAAGLLAAALPAERSTARQARAPQAVAGRHMEDGATPPPSPRTVARWRKPKDS
ncbi:MFS transporter [Kineococcus rhizosphaerae]|uniref:MFS transporter n=1 Tax=Kineococcus rhizosphaerae TaxID=559628 RepID=UPI001475FE95|nr:MFS transporter [Kineococcus rhizosphaerae]